MSGRNFFDFEIFNLAESLEENEISALTGNPKIIVAFDSQHTSSEGLSLLADILKATKTSESDIFHLPLQPQRDISLSTTTGPDNQLLLVFGLKPSRLGYQIDEILYDPFRINGRVLFFSQPLDTLKSNRELKRTLWIFLKEFFAIQ